jgi:hypothetical protein
MQRTLALCDSAAQMRTPYGKDFMEKQLYWSVRCLTCDSPIALDLIRFDSRGIGKTVVWTLEPFRAYCPICQTEEEYEKDQVVMWWGPPPSPDFRPHLSLR